MNRYNGTYNVPVDEVVTQSKITVTAVSMEEAAKFLTSDQGTEPFSLTLAEQNALVVDETQKVAFTTTITPAGAISAGAKATPTSFSVVPGTVVIFEAEVPAGYDFVKWTKDGEDAGTDLVQEIGITQDGTAIIAEFVVQ